MKRKTKQNSKRYIKIEGKQYVGKDAKTATELAFEARLNRINRRNRREQLEVSGL